MQVSAVPRLLATHGQGYGYAVAWSLATLLQPAVLQHIRQAVETAKAQDAAGVQAQQGRPGAAHSPTAVSQQLWRQLMSMGAQVSDVQVLTKLLGQPQLQRCDHFQHQHGLVAAALQKRGLWPVHD